MSPWPSCVQIRPRCLATNADVLNRLVALKVVATTDPKGLPAELYTASKRLCSLRGGAMR